MAVLTIVGCTGGKGGARHVPQPSDTLYTQEAVMRAYGAHQSELALAIVDSAEAMGNIPHNTAEFLRARIYVGMEEGRYIDTARQICEALLEIPATRENSGFHFDVLEELVSIVRLEQDDEQYLRRAMQLADLCRERGEETEALRTEAEIGVVLTHLGQKEEGMRKLDNAIASLDPVRRFNELDASVIAMKRKINVLTDYRQYKDIIQLAQRILEKLDDYEQHPADYADGSYREPSEEDRRGYIDFYRAQAMGFLANAYAEEGDKKQARHYVDLFEQTGYGQSYNGRCVIAPAWYALGEYGKILEMSDEVERCMGGDTLNIRYATILHYRAMAAYAQGHPAASQAYWQRYDALSQEVNDSLQVSKAHDYAARYHAQEQQLEIQRKDAELSRRNLLVVAGFVIALLAIGFAIWFFRQRNVVNRKNRVLASQIAEAITYKEQFEKLKLQESTTAMPDSQESAVEERSVNLDEVTNDQLFAYMCDIIRREQLFLNPSFDRQAAVDYFHLSKERIGSAFSQGSDYSSFPDFIRDCRLDYACNLLTTRTDMSISDIVSASGFSNASVFSRYFKNKYTLSPTDYRREKRNG